MSIGRRSVLVGAGAVGASAVLTPRYLRAQNAPLRIGGTFPLTGMAADSGAVWHMGAQLAVSAINEAGGLLGRQVELVVRDDKYSAAGAVAAAREIAGLGVNLMVGGCQSPLALAVGPILDELKAVLVSPGATAMSLTHENFHRNLFRLIPNAYLYYGGVGVAMAERFPDVNDWSMIIMDTEGGRDAEKFFRAGLVRAAGARKVQFHDPIYVPFGKTDFRVEVNNLMNQSAKGLYIGLVGKSCLGFLQQARSVGLSQRLSAMADMGLDLQVGKALKQATPSNYWSPGFWYPQNSPFKGNPISEKMYKDYVARTNDRYPIGMMNTAHRSCLALFAAIKKAGSTETKDVIAALEGLTFETAGGPYRIRKEDHQGYGTSVYGRIAPRDTEPYYGVADVITVDDAKTIEPPAPGQKYVLPG